MEHKVPTKQTSSPTLPTAQQQLFTSTLMSLTWQLAIVILVPIIGGHIIDQSANTNLRWTFIGLGVAVVLAGLCLYNGYRIVTKATNKDTTDA